MRSVLVFISCILASIGSEAQHFSNSCECTLARSELLNLEFAQAEKHIHSIEQSDPDNLMAVYLADLKDFLFIVVNEDETEFNRRKNLRSERLKMIEKAPDNSPYKLLSIGEIHLHWAFSMIRFGEYFGGALEVNRAFHALEKNREEHPDFLPTYKSLGLLHILIGTVPDNYQWATRLMGVDGTIKQGLAEMNKVIELSKNDPSLYNLRKETLFLLSFLQMNLLNDPAALKLSSDHLENETGPLMDFAKASVAKKSGNTERAIATLEFSIGQRPDAFPYLYYMLGSLKLARMDHNADVPLKHYLQHFKGKSYVRAARLKLAWHALLIKSDTDGYHQWISRIPERGSSMLDEDKTAMSVYESETMPNTVLLKARLQFDAGFYKQSLETLISSDRKAIATSGEQLEFTYRLGRIHHELDHFAEALSYYKMTIENGKDSKRYFAANASLQSGLICEQLNRKDAALKAFKACKNFNNSEYRNGINQKARAGIERIENSSED